MSNNLSEYKNSVQLLVDSFLSQIDEMNDQDVFTIEYDASSQDVYEAMNYIINNESSIDILYARKIVTKDDDTNSYVTGISFTKNPKTYQLYVDQNFSYPLDTFPTFIAIKKSKKVKILYEEKTISYEEWKKLNNLNLNKNDLVIVSDDSTFTNINDLPILMYLGINVESPNGQIYLLSDFNEENRLYAFHGTYTPTDYLDDTYALKKTFFLSVNEYKYLLKCRFEILEKANLLAITEYKDTSFIKSLKDNN